MVAIFHRFVLLKCGPFLRRYPHSATSTKTRRQCHGYDDLSQSTFYVLSDWCWLVSDTSLTCCLPVLWSTWSFLRSPVTVSRYRVRLLCIVTVSGYCVSLLYPVNVSRYCVHFRIVDINSMSTYLGCLHDALLCFFSVPVCRLAGVFSDAN